MKKTCHMIIFIIIGMYYFFRKRYTLIISELIKNWLLIQIDKNQIYSFILL